MLPIKKIYVDTRFMNLNSKSSSDFTIDLPQSYTFPDNTVAYIDDVCIPVSWYTIQEGWIIIYTYESTALLELWK